MDDPHLTAPQLARHLNSACPELVEKIIKLAESPLLGYPKQLSSINSAIASLGFQAIKNLIIIASIIETIKQQNTQANLNINRFWTHALAVALGFKIITTEKNISYTSDLLLISSLHDIGRIVLAENFANEYHTIITEAKSTLKPLSNAESSHFKCTSADIGKWLFEQWNLPSDQTDTIAYIDHPWEYPHKPNLAMVLHFADILADQAGYDLIENEPHPDIHSLVINEIQPRQNDDGKIIWEYYLYKLNDEMKSAREIIILLTT